MCRSSSFKCCRFSTNIVSSPQSDQPANRDVKNADRRKLVSLWSVCLLCQNVCLFLIIWFSFLFKRFQIAIMFSFLLWLFALKTIQVLLVIMLYFSAQNYETATKKSNAMLKFKDIFFKYDKIRTTSKQNNRLIS